LFKITSEMALLTIFVVVNSIFFLLSYEGSSFIEGADASQYYEPAISFINTGQFILAGEPLTFGTPLYSIFLAFPIYIFGIEGSEAAIVFFQCVFLYITGFIAKKILLNFSSKFGILLHALVIFNPNSLVTAHLVQSETLFTLLFVLSIFYALKGINNFSWKNIILIAFLTGLASLTRPISLYFILLYPLFILTALIIKKEKSVNNVTIIYTNNFWIKLLSLILIGGLVVSPWYLRNYVKFETFFFTSNAGPYLQDQYFQLKNQGAGWPLVDSIKELKRKTSHYLDEEEKESFCLDNDRDWSCNSLIKEATIGAIIEEPLNVHARAFYYSWGALFFSGGASNIRNYLGIDGKALNANFQNNSFKGFNSIKKLVNDMNLPYFLIFTFTTLFAFISRILGLFGVFYVLKSNEWRYYGVFLLEIITFLVASYLYLGQSRFRVPIEPILMLFSILGILFILSVKTRKVNI
jgi:hypothetical protein